MTMEILKGTRAPVQAEAPGRSWRSIRPGDGAAVLLALLSLAATVLVVLEWRARRAPDALLRTVAVGNLQMIVGRQRTYYENNHLYGSSLAELGLDQPPGGPWEYQLVTGSLEGSSIALVEAGREDLVLGITSRGGLFSSIPRPLPPVTRWQPPAEESHEAPP